MSSRDSKPPTDSAFLLVMLSLAVALLLVIVVWQTYSPIEDIPGLRSDTTGTVPTLILTPPP